MNEIKISSKVLEDLYWKKNLSSAEIAKIFEVNPRTIRKKLTKQGIKTKTVSEALTKKFKKEFSGDLIEKAYFLGMRAGDFYAKWVRICIRIQTSTTHPAQINFLKKAFKKYGELRVTLVKNKERQDEWFIYEDLHNSFNFLIKKPEKIDSEILKNKEAFYNFFSSYMDCEANWNIAKSHKTGVKFLFRIRTSDKIILEQIKKKMKEEKINLLLNLDKKKGTKTPYGTYSKDIYNLSLSKKQEIIQLAKKLLPLSNHNEKIKKMKFIIKNKNKKWNEIEKKWKKLRVSIKKSLLKNLQKQWNYNQ
ncbi:MAG: hypothetical protein ABIA76_03820 [Candidatus Diapherotrites archaeon]